MKHVNHYHYHSSYFPKKFFQFKNLAVCFIISFSFQHEATKIRRVTSAYINFDVSLNLRIRKKTKLSNDPRGLEERPRGH